MKDSYVWVLNKTLRMFRITPSSATQLNGVALIVTMLAAFAVADDNWPQFRAHGGAGIGNGKPPIHWDVDSRKNVAWKTSIPGLGHSAPIVWENRVFVTTAVNSESDRPSVKTGWSGSDLVWWEPRDGSYMPTPLICDKLLYTCNDNGRLTVRNALTGEVAYRNRIGAGRRTYSA